VGAAGARRRDGRGRCRRPPPRSLRPAIASGDGAASRNAFRAAALLPAVRADQLWVSGDERTAGPMASAAAGRALDPISRGRARVEVPAETASSSGARGGTLDGGGAGGASGADLRLHRGVEAAARASCGACGVATDSQQPSCPGGPGGPRAREGKSRGGPMDRPLRNLFSPHRLGAWSDDRGDRATSGGRSLPAARSRRREVRRCPGASRTRRCARGPTGIRGRCAARGVDPGAPAVPGRDQHSSDERDGPLGARRAGGDDGRLPHRSGVAAGRGGDGSLGPTTRAGPALQWSARRHRKKADARRARRSAVPGPVFSGPDDKLARVQ